MFDWYVRLIFDYDLLIIFVNNDVIRVICLFWCLFEYVVICMNVSINVNKYVRMIVCFVCSYEFDFS